MSAWDREVDDNSAGAWFYSSIFLIIGVAAIFENVKAVVIATELAFIVIGIIFLIKLWKLK